MNQSGMYHDKTVDAIVRYHMEADAPVQYTNSVGEEIVSAVDSLVISKTVLILKPFAHSSYFHKTG